MATFRKRCDKWHVQVRRKGSPNLTRTFTRKTDAVEWANERERRAERRGLCADPRILERLSVADSIIRFRDTIVPQRPGKANETIVLNAFLRRPIAATQLSELFAACFAAYRDERLQAVRPATINRELGLIQRAFQVA